MANQQIPNQVPIAPPNQPQPQGDFDPEALANAFTGGDAGPNWCRHTTGCMAHSAPADQLYCPRHRRMHDPIVRAKNAIRKQGNRMIRARMRHRLDVAELDQVVNEFSPIAAAFASDVAGAHTRLQNNLLPGLQFARQMVSNPLRYFRPQANQQAQPVQQPSQPVVQFQMPTVGVPDVPMIGGG